MKTMLIPVDFSPTTKNAVDFAAQWCVKYEYNRIILLKTFYDSMYENIILSAEYMNVNEETLNRQREEASETLAQLCNYLAGLLPAEIEVTSAVSESPIVRSVIELIQNENAELLVLGSNTINDQERSTVADNVISLAKASPVRVLIVPSHSVYQPVYTALLPFNFDMVDELDRLKHLKAASQWSDIKLMVLNLNTPADKNKFLVQLKLAEEKFHDLLKNYEYELFFSKDKDFAEGISDFTQDHKVQLIISLPRKHSFLYSLTHKSISEAILRNARMPVLILK